MSLTFWIYCLFSTCLYSLLSRGMFIQYKDASKATRPAFAQYRPGSLLALWIADMPCLCLRSSMHIQFTVVASIKDKKWKCMSSLRNTRKGHLQQTSKIVLIKTLPDILSFDTFFSGIHNCSICFTSSLFTEAIQAHTVSPSFPPPFLTKYIFHIPPTSSQSTVFLYQPLFHDLDFKERQNLTPYTFCATPLQHTHVHWWSGKTALSGQFLVYHAIIKSHDKAVILISHLTKNSQSPVLRLNFTCFTEHGFYKN